ncbi:MAG: hypothetical protein WC107_02515 [Patescibacteria group bacterium]
MGKMTIDELAMIVAKGFEEMSAKIESEVSLVRTDLSNEISAVRTDLSNEISSVRMDIHRLDSKTTSMQQDIAFIRKRTLEDDNAIVADVVQLTKKLDSFDKRITKLEIAKV